MELALRIVVTAELVVLALPWAARSAYVAARVRGSRQPGLLRAASATYALFGLTFLLAAFVYGGLFVETIAYLIVGVSAAVLMPHEIRTVIRLMRGARVVPGGGWSMVKTVMALTFIAAIASPFVFSFFGDSYARMGESWLMYMPGLAGILALRPIRRLSPQQRRRVMAGLDPEEEHAEPGMTVALPPPPRP